MGVVVNKEENQEHNSIKTIKIVNNNTKYTTTPNNVTFVFLEKERYYGRSRKSMAWGNKLRFVWAKDRCQMD